MKRLLSVLFSFVGLLAACATTDRGAASVQDVTGGFAVAVDASTVNKNTIGRDDFSVPDNRAIATLVGEKVADTLARKGYTTAGPVVTIAGARLDTMEKYSITDMDGKKIDAPETAQPPFMVEPALSDAARAHIAPLFGSLLTSLGRLGKLGDKQLPSVNPAHLDVAADGGAILAVVCEGHVPSAGSRAAAIGTAFVAVIAATAGGAVDKGAGELRTQSKAEIYLIDRRSGATLWHDSVEAHDVSPAFFADAVGKMLEKLPPPRNP